MSKAAGGRVLSEIQDLRKALDKAIKGSDSAGSVLDILRAIESFPMTPTLIKDSKMGKVLVSTRTKFTAEESSTVAAEVANKARDILVEWKKIIEDHMKNEKNEKDNTIKQTASSSETAPAVLKIKKTVLETASGRIREEVAAFSDARRKVINLLAGYLKLSTSDASKAEMVAYTIDKAVDDLHSFDLDNKSYMGIVRSLAFNLKRNESLRSDLISGALTAKLLVTLSPEDLATDELRKARQSINEEDRQSRRTDWLEEHKGKIQVGMGLDPNNVWEFEEEVESDAE